MNPTRTGSSFGTIDAFVDYITAPSRAAEAAVQLDRTENRSPLTGDPGWTITKDGVTIELTAFEMRRMVARVTSVQNAESPIPGHARREINPELAHLVRS